MTPPPLNPNLNLNPPPPPTGPGVSPQPSPTPHTSDFDLRPSDLPTPFRIGVISDTHNYLDRKVRGIFEGVDHILHGGDIGFPSIIIELEQIAPVTAVYGNTDDPTGWKETERLELASHKFFIQHIVDPLHPDDILRSRLEKYSPDVVVFGHTHKPFNQTINGVLFLNPGYAGKQRFKLSRSVAVLSCGEGQPAVEWFKLE